MFLLKKTRNTEFQQRLDAAKRAIGDVFGREFELCFDELVIGVIPPHPHGVSHLIVRVDFRCDDGATAPHSAKANVNILSYFKHDVCEASSIHLK
jgi:hypothetical protein